MRKDLDLTQQEFADKLNIKRNTVATYEIGKSNPSDAAVVLICKTFNVSEAWLRHGEGEMFVKREPQPLEEVLTQLIRGREITKADRILIKNFLELPEGARKEAIAFIRKCAQEIGEEGQAQPQVAEVFQPQAEPDEPEQLDAGIEREVENFRRRLLLEKSQAGTLSPSSEGTEKMA